MITLTVTYQMPEDQDSFQRAHFSNEAWFALDAALNTIRNHQKHGALTADQTIETVRELLVEARRCIE